MRPQKATLSAACVAAGLLNLGFSAFSAQRAPGTRPVQAGRRPRSRAAPRNRTQQGLGDGRRIVQARPIQTGVLRNDDGAFPGYTLFAPLRSTTTYLIDMQGNVAHSWESDSTPGHAVYLLKNGNLLRCGREEENRTFRGGGLGGKVQEFAWDGTLVWEFSYSNDQHCQHHDIEPLPGGNVLLIAWERKSEAEAIAAGRHPALSQGGDLWPDHIVEVKPRRPRGGTIVWEWHVWDHVIQDHDPAKANYGAVADHPELIDINFPKSSMELSPQERRRLEALGYMPRSTKPRAGKGQPDWNHINAIAYNAELDQIALSVLRFNEIWVIDHSTTTEQAAGHAGGRSGKGGDILYRWGNPQAYRAGTAGDQQLFAHHDVHWITRGRPGAGNLLVFNNGLGRPDGRYSSVDEIVPPVDETGRYAREVEAAFGPAKPTWVYTAAQKTRFYSPNISGAQRLPNGNTLICSGEQGRFFEIDPDGRTVWEYVNPFARGIIERLPGTRPGLPARPRPGVEPGGPPHATGGGRPGGGDQRRDRPQGVSGGPRGVFRATRLPADFPGLAGKDLEVPGP
jgi:hypothetical protein